MPQGLPTVEQVSQGEVTFFSIDTDVIQAAGYNFDAGALHQLPKQLPSSMRLQMTGVVVEEIVRHRMQPVNDAIDAFKSASRNLIRLAEIPMAPIDHTFASLGVADAATARFREEVQAYAARCRGGVLPISGVDLAGEVFNLYFREAPPFESSRAKKAEFPYAAALIMLERFARANDTKGIVMSRDAGWAAFAESSDYLYAVETIEDLATLFAATDAHAAAVKAALLAAIDEDRSALRTRLDEAMAKHVAEADWDIGDVSSGSGRVEAEVINVGLTDYHINRASLDAWQVEEEPSTWVVEVLGTVHAMVDIEVNFFVWDSIDREELSIGYNTLSVPMEIEVTAYLNCSDVELDNRIEEWQVDPEVARGRYSVGEINVEPDFSDPD